MTPAIRGGDDGLSLAAKHNQADVVRYLLEQGADPSIRESFFGETALDMALWKGGSEFRIARMLLAAGAADRFTALRGASSPAI